MSEQVEQNAAPVRAGELSGSRATLAPVAENDEHVAPVRKKTAKQIRDEREQEDREREEDSRLHEKKISWWSRVWIPALAALAGFGVGLGTCASAYFQRDVRNQVWEATYEEKERVQQKQAEILKLQEDYLGKLQQLQQGQAALATAQEQLKAKELEAQAIKVQGERALAALRSRYARLDAAENARVAKERADAATLARRRPWVHYGCSTSIVFQFGGDKGRCADAMKAVFAANTPDEKTVVAPTSTCSDADGWSELFSTASAKCETYARTFLAAKGLTDDDATAILETFRWAHLDGGASLPGNNEAAGKALQDRFAKPK